MKEQSSMYLASSKLLSSCQVLVVVCRHATAPTSLHKWLRVVVRSPGADWETRLPMQRGTQSPMVLSPAAPTPPITPMRMAQASRLPEATLKKF
eukprot:2006383-Amphidinium_carterae.1